MDEEIKFAQTYWCVADVRKELGEESKMWTDQKCEELLSGIEEELKDEMTQAGWKVIENRVAKSQLTI
jgi:hypothetical protein